jgi:peptidoglycan-N-acetylglucosamine deacetylase
MRVFRVIRGRKVLLLALTLLLVGFAVLRSLPPLERRFLGVAKDVYFLDYCLTGLLADEVAGFLAEKAPGFSLEPVDARADPEYADGVVPHLTGFRLAVSDTLAEILQAKPGARINPVLQQIEPQVSLADFPESAIYRGNPVKDQVAFMINVAWGTEYLPSMLEVLEREGVKATFFLVGRWAENNEEMVRELHSRGHELASHGYDDGIVLKGLSQEAAQADIEKSLQIIEACTREKVRYFTPHKGEHDGASLKACSLLDVRMVLWSLDTADWLKPGVEKMLERTVHKAYNGAVILMHPTRDGAAYLAAALPGLREKGLQAVPVGTLLNPHEREYAVERAEEP